MIYENGAGGHRAAALAITEALREIPETDASSLELDTLAPKSRKRMYSMFMDMRRFFRPVVRFGFGWALWPNPIFQIYRSIDSIVQPFALRRFLEVVEREAPDLIVTAHYRPNLACNTWLERAQLKTPVHSIVPDFVAHGLYAQPMLGRYYVATEAVRKDLVVHGVAPERVVVTGLPVALSMVRADPRNREEVKRALGLLPDVPMLLVMGGARGDQEYGTILRALDQRGARIQVVVLCGWNEMLRARVEAIAAELRVEVHVKSFQDNMAEWYRAADLILTKPGGMTTAEALAMGKAIMLTSPHPGKEEVQAERLAGAGVVLYEWEPVRAVEAALQILADPASLHRMEILAAGFQQPLAAQRIASDLVQAARKAAAAAA